MGRTWTYHCLARLQPFGGLWPRRTMPQGKSAVCGAGAPWRARVVRARAARRCLPASGKTSLL